MYICEIHELEELSSHQFEFMDCGEIKYGFVLNWHKNIFAYMNRCPHTGVELNWHDNIFFNYDNSAIQCTTHGALFKITNGLCIWGPCRGQFLESITVKIENSKIYVNI